MSAMEKRNLVDGLRRQMTAAEERTRVYAYVLVDLVDSLTESEWTNGSKTHPPKFAKSAFVYSSVIGSTIPIVPSHPRWAN